MKVLTPLLVVLVLHSTALAQNGYVKFYKHSITKGYVKIREAEKIHEQVIEFGLSENDPSPKHFHKKDILEYAIHTDTFRILKDFYPYEVSEIYFDLVEAKVIQSGKVSLLRIDNAHHLIRQAGATEASADFHDESVTKVPHMYVLHDADNDYVRGIPSKKEKFDLVIPDFFSEEELAEYTKAHGKPHYKDLEKMVMFYRNAGR
jgi:hypothetical protein